MEKVISLLNDATSDGSNFYKYVKKAVNELSIYIYNKYGTLGFDRNTIIYDECLDILSDLELVSAEVYDQSKLEEIVGRLSVLEADSSV